MDSMYTASTSSLQRWEFCAFIALYIANALNSARNDKVVMNRI